jgi:hypothetical protein
MKHGNNRLEQRLDTMFTQRLTNFLLEIKKYKNKRFRGKNFRAGLRFFYHHDPSIDNLHGGNMKQSIDKKLNLYEEVCTLFYENNETINAEWMLKCSVEKFGTSLGTIYLKLSVEDTTTVEKLKEHFYNMDEILEEEIDPAIELIHSANPQFYKEYFTLRAMIPTGLQHTHESAMAV